MMTVLKITCVDDSIEPMDFILRKDFNSIVKSLINVYNTNPLAEFLIDDKFRLEILICKEKVFERKRNKLCNRFVDLFDITRLANNC